MPNLTDQPSLKLPRKPDGTAITAEELLQKDLVNVLKKMQSGKPLNPSERKLIMAAGYGADTQSDSDKKATLPKRAKDKTFRLIIEKEFDLSERKAYSWLNKLREKYWTKSGQWRVADAIDEIETRRQSALRGPETDVKREKLKLECDILRDRRDRDRSMYISVDDHRARIQAIVNTCKRTIQIWVSTTAAEIGTPEIKAKLEQAQRKAFAAAEAEYDEQANG